MHISCVRGSPLIRLLCVIVAILATGWLFFRLTDRQVVVNPDRAAEDTQKPGQRVRARFVMTFSDRPAHIELSSAGESVSRTFSSESTENEIRGDLLLNPEDPVVSVRVNWYELGDKHGFVKMVLEVEGQPTITRVFDAAGNIDDLMEVAF